jgi:hypothetical protein
MYLLNGGASPYSSAAARWRARAGMAAATAGLAALGLTAAGCAGPAASVSLPVKAADTGSAAPAALTGTPAPRTPQQAVASAYRGYWRAYAAAMTAASATRAEAILAPYEAPSGMTQLITNLQAIWNAHDTAYGGAVTHVKSVRITGRQAILNDCLDLSHFGVTDRRTGRVVPDSFGLANQDFYITLLRSGGRWRVSNMQPVEVPCEP